MTVKADFIFLKTICYFVFLSFLQSFEKSQLSFIRKKYVNVLFSYSIHYLTVIFFIYLA